MAVTPKVETEEERRALKLVDAEVYADLMVESINEGSALAAGYWTKWAARNVFLARPELRETHSRTPESSQ